MTAPLCALVEGNNFYVSCERVYRPSLRGHTEVVLPNNDGCAISRSDEAKELGIRMDTPYFKIQNKRQEGAVIARSTQPQRNFNDRTLVQPGS